MGLYIDIAVEHDAWHALGDLDALAARAAAAVLAASGMAVAEGAEWSIVLADDAFVQDLNARWRGKDCPTNVLAFPPAAGARCACRAGAGCWPSAAWWCSAWASWVRAS